MVLGVCDCALTQRQLLVFSDLPSNDSPLVNISQVQVSPPQLSALGMKWSTTIAISVSTQGRASEMVEMCQMPDTDSLADAQIIADSSPAVNQPQETKKQFSAPKIEARENGDYCNSIASMHKFSSTPAIVNYCSTMAAPGLPSGAEDHGMTVHQFAEIVEHVHRRRRRRKQQQKLIRATSTVSRVTEEILPLPFFKVPSWARCRLHGHM